MSEGTNSSESVSETAKPESIAKPGGKGRNLWVMIIAVIIVLILIAAAIIVMPKKKETEEEVSLDLVAVINGTLSFDAGSTNNVSITVTLLTTYASNDTTISKDVTNDTGTDYFWSITPFDVGSFSYKGLPVVPFKAAIEAGVGNVTCEVSYRATPDTPDEDVLEIVVYKALTVLPPYLDAVSISPVAKTIQPDGNWTFTATAVSSVGLPLSGVDFTWSIVNESGVYANLSTTTGPIVRVDAGSVFGNATLTATGDYSGDTKSGTAAITIGYPPPRSMDYYFYDFFDVPIGSWYDVRWPVYHQEEILSYSNPSLMLYHSSEDNIYLYSLLRMNITGKNVSEVNTNTWPEFLPILSPTERGGTAVIDWYMQYLTHDEMVARYPGFATQDDGWIIVLNGTATLDKQAAKMVLNLTENGYNSFDTWWSNNGPVVIERYSKFLVDEAEIRVDIENAYESYFQLFTNAMTAEKVGDNIVLHYDLVTWGMEALMMRWLHECFLPIEMWYEDMNIHMTIGPEWADINIDTAITYALMATETMDSMGSTDVTPCWTFQGILGDAVESSEAHPHSDLDKYLPYSYINRQPDSPIYGEYMQYDVVPAVWNLTDNETLTFAWPDGEQLFRYRIGQGEAVNIYDEIAVRYSEPDATDVGADKVNVDDTNRTIKFTGPLNMWEWSRSQTTHQYLKDEWFRLGGTLLPYWQPYLEFETMDPVRIYLNHFDVTVDDSVPANDDATVRVEAINNYGFTYFGYNGTVNFTSTDAAAILPDNYTFVPGTDHGVHTFVGGAKFLTLGSQTLRVENVSTELPLMYGTKTFNVTEMRNVSSMEVDVYYVPSVGVPEDVTVTVYDQYGDRFLNYTGTITFTSDRPSDVTFPSDYTFLLSDAGEHTIPGGLTFNAVGWFNITASDTVNMSANGTESDIWVSTLPQAIDHFTVAGIRDMLTRQKSDVRVTAYDQNGLVFKRYTGTIHFSANASGGVFPADYTFTLADEGFKEFENGVSFSSQGVFTVTVSDTVVPGATGSQSNIVIEYRPAAETFTMYDFFQEPWQEWWPWRYKGYKTDITLNNETGKYTMIYNADKRGNAGIIYAPYRWNITGTNISQVSIHNPEFMPVLGTPGVSGAEASIDVYFQYLSWDWWNSYWKPTWAMDQSVMDAQSTDGWYPGVIYTVTMNRAAAEEWMGMPQGPTTNPNTWWAINGGKYLADWRAWIYNEGNVRLDIWAGFEWPYVDAGAKMKLNVLPDGKIQLQIGHIGEGYEILMTRWLNETNLNNHEAYYEDMSMHVDYYDKWMNFDFDAVCQYSMRAVQQNQTSTNLSAWSWQPLLIDYVPSWLTPGGLHPSKFDPWANYTYQSHNAGDPSFKWEVPYDSGYSNFSLADYQTFIIKIPTGSDNLGYYAQYMSATAIRDILRGLPNPPYEPWPRGDGTHYDYGDYWPLMYNGTMTLGWVGNWSGNPDLTTMYDPVTNVVTMHGPLIFSNTRLPNGSLYFGAPWIEFNVNPV